MGSKATQTWGRSQSPPPLGRGEIHIWRLSLECNPPTETQLRRLLTDDERQRADRFLADVHRRRFIAGRARMRQLLGMYVDQQPQQIKFDYSGLGKPTLKADGGHPIQFNFSNSSERALLAIHRDLEIGVDLERLRNVTNLEGLAERFFALPEKEFIFAREGQAQIESFFHCWTRKEAFLKAIGKGLTFPLCDVTIQLSDQRDVAIDEINDPTEDAKDWFLEHLAVDDEYVGAIACKCSGALIRQLHFDTAGDD